VVWGKVKLQVHHCNLFQPLPFDHMIGMQLVSPPKVHGSMNLCSSQVYVWVVGSCKCVIQNSRCSPSHEIRIPSVEGPAFNVSKGPGRFGRQRATCKQEYDS